MSLRVYTKKGKEKLKLKPKPFASGGEGHLYKILSPINYQNYVVKIYHPHKLGPSIGEKIKYLQQHPPQGVEKDAIVWIHDTVENERGHVLGFIMPFIKGEKLEILCMPKLPRKLANTWYRFHADAPDVLELRLKVCYNLAAAVHQIHDCGCYILVDLKPDNVIITPEGLVSLVDLDSVEVVENGIKLFDAPVATPEYTPPEFYKKNEHDPTQQQAWDRFSLAVIFYKLLMGVHPFAGTFHPPFDKATSLSQKIEEGLFVHHPDLHQKRAAIPPPHRAFHVLSDKLKDLFLTCFVAGAEQPQVRPTAHEWCSAIMQYLDVHRLRTLPSKKISLPASVDDLSQFLQKNTVPSDYLEQKGIEPLGIDKGDHKVISQNLDLAYLLPLRRLNMVILGVGLTAAFSFLLGPNYKMGLAILVLTCIGFALFIYLTFANRVSGNKLLEIFKTLREQRSFYQKQEHIYKAIKTHMDQFYEQLQKEQKRLFPKQFYTTKENIDQEIETILKNLHLEMDKTDQVAKDWIDSEIFEFNALKDKYNRALHTFPAFANASSLDAELAAIDFALQEEMEHLQKILGRELKIKQLEYDKVFERNQLVLEKKERAYRKKVGKFKKQIEQAKKQEIKKTFTKIKRQLTKGLLSVEENADTHLTLFKDEILGFLDQHKITQMTQIKQIEAPGKVTLETGEVISIAPLRYYQIHELSEWWLAAKKGIFELPAHLLKDIEVRYDHEFEDFKETAKKEYLRAASADKKRKQKLTREAQKVYVELRDQNKPQIQVLKKKYTAQKDFLERLFKERYDEEKEIHKRYELKFEQLETALQAKSDDVSALIRELCQMDNLSTKQLDTYQKNLTKYTIGLERLEEEYSRLRETSKRYEISKITKEHYDKMDFVDHLKKMMFFKPMIPNQ